MATCNEYLPLKVGLRFGERVLVRLTKRKSCQNRRNPRLLLYLKAISCVQSCRSTQEYRARKTLTKDSDKKNQVRYYVTFWYLIRVCKCNLKRYGNCSAIFILFDFLALYFVIDTIYRQEELLWYNSSQKILVLFLISRHLSNCENDSSIFP